MAADAESLNARGKIVQSIILSQHVRNQPTGRRLQWDDGIAFLGSNTFRQICASRDPEVIVSLEAFDYLDSDGLLWLLLLGDFLRTSGKSPWLELPEQASQLQFLRLNSFLAIAQDVFSITNLFYLDDANEKPKKGPLRFWRVDISTIGTLLSGVTRDLHLVLADILKISPYDEIGVELIQPFVILITEINRNIVQHSRGHDGDGWGYFVLDVRHTKQGPSLIFAVGDSGLGFRRSLASKGLSLRNDEEAIKHAVLFRYYNREGEGLFRAVQFASRLNGIVKLRSGRGIGSLDLQKAHLQDDDQVRSFINSNLRTRNEATDFPGVQFYVNVFGRRYGRK